MLTFVMAALLGLSSLLVVAFAVCAALVRGGGWRGREGMALAAGLAVSPVIVGLLSLPMLAFGLTGPVLAAAPGLALAPVLFLAGAHHVSIVALFEPLLAAPRWVLALIVALVAAVVAQCLTIAISEGDALDYITAGRIIARDGGLAHYPFLTPDPLTGYYAPSIHPPAFHLLVAWVAGTAPDSSLLVLRLACALALLSVALLVAHLVTHRGGSAGGLAALLVLATPILVAMGLSFNSDPVRIAAVVAALAGVTIAIGSGSVHAAVAAGLITALAMWAHSAGLIAPAVGLAVFILCRAGLRLVAAYAIMAGVAGGGWYAMNALSGGAVISDSWPAAEWPALAYTADMLARRGLDTLGGRLMNGALQAFTDPALIGIGFWLSALGVAAGVVRPSHPSERLALIALGGFLGVAVVMALLERETIIKNIRYVMTVAPFAALLGGIVLARMIDGHGRLARPAAFVCVLVTCWALAGMALRSHGMSSMAPVLGQPESWALTRDRFVGGRLLERLAAEGPGRVLTFRQPDMAHVPNRPWLDHFDPALGGIHSAAPAAAVAALAARDVRLVYVPAQTPVTLTRSALGLVLADPRFARPLADHRGARLFALEPAEQTMACRIMPAIDMTTAYRPRGMVDWLADLTRIPRIAALGDRPVQSGPAVLPVTLGMRGVGAEDLMIAPGPTPAARTVVSVSIAGTSLFELSADFADSTGRTRRQPLLNGLAPRELRRLSAQVLAQPGERLTGFILGRPSGQSGSLRIEQVSVCLVGS